MPSVALLPSEDQVGDGGIMKAGLGGGGGGGGREPVVVGEEADAARCCKTSRMVEVGGGWEEESVVVLVEARSVEKMLSELEVLLWLSVESSSGMNSRRI